MLVKSLKNELEVQAESEKKEQAVTAIQGLLKDVISKIGEAKFYDTDLGKKLSKSLLSISEGLEALKPIDLSPLIQEMRVQNEAIISIISKPVGKTDNSSTDALLKEMIKMIGRNNELINAFKQPDVSEYLKSISEAIQGNKEVEIKKRKLTIQVTTDPVTSNKVYNIEET